MKLKFISLISVYSFLVMNAFTQENYKHFTGPLKSITKDLKNKDTSFFLNPTILTKANTLTKQNINGRVLDGNDIRVFASPNPQAEVHISINKNTPNNLIASCNTFLGVIGGDWIYNQGYYYTNNNGQSWLGRSITE